MSTTFVLGAGFSRAISGAMPLMADLGEVARMAVDEFPLPDTRPRPQDDIEVWLSYALEDQPFLRPDQNLLNRAAAEKVLLALRDNVVMRQGSAEHEGIPEWLDDLVAIWHGLRVEVVTLNWDTLLEDAVDALRLWSLSYPTSRLDDMPISSDDILERVPRLAAGSPSGGPPGRITFRLHKLHGSIDWYWGEGDPFGDTVVRRPSSRPAVGDAAGIAGKTTFFAAPAAAKGMHYRNQIVRHVWRRAREAIERADELVLIGYSMPPSDQAVRALLGGTTARRICVVDPRAADYTPRIREVFGDDGGFGLVEVLSTDEFVAGLADSFMQGHVLQLVQQWTDERDVPVLASLANAKHAPVTAVLRKETEIEVVGSTWFTSLNEATGLTAPRGLVAQEILEAVKAGTKTFVRNEAGDRRLIYDVTPLRREIGRSPVWMQLRCQG